LDLADAGAAEGEAGGEFLHGAVVEEEGADDGSVAGIEGGEEGLDQVVVAEVVEEGGELGGEVRLGLGGRGADAVDEGGDVFLLDVVVEGVALRGSGGGKDVGEAVRGGVAGSGEFGDRWGTAVFGGVFGGEAADTGEEFVVVDGEADGAALDVDGAGDGLADPPVGVGGDGVAPGGVEEFEAADEADVALLDEIGELEAAPLVFLGDRDDQAEVGADHDVHGAAAGLADSGGGGVRVCHPGTDAATVAELGLAREDGVPAYGVEVGLEIVGFVRSGHGIRQSGSGRPRGRG
jgi:hypothetical protein